MCMGGGGGWKGVLAIFVFKFLVINTFLRGPYKPPSRSNYWFLINTGADPPREVIRPVRTSIYKETYSQL